MSNGKEYIFLSFLVGLLTGIAIFSAIDRQTKRRLAKLNKIKDDLDKGYAIDKENLTNDWQHIYYDLDRSYKKLKQDTRYETS